MANGRIDSPCDESASLMGPDDRSASPSMTPTMTISNGQISKRTLEKQRKQIKAARTHAPMMVKMPQQGNHSLRYESLTKRKRTLELTSQKLLCDKECLLLERKNLDIRLAMNENEHERILLEKRRLDLVIQKYSSSSTSSSSAMTNGNHSNNHLSDLDDHEDNPSGDEMSDLND